MPGRSFISAKDNYRRNPKRIRQVHSAGNRPDKDVRRGNDLREALDTGLPGKTVEPRAESRSIGKRFGSDLDYLALVHESTDQVEPEFTGPLLVLCPITCQRLDYHPWPRNLCQSRGKVRIRLG